MNNEQHFFDVLKKLASVRLSSEEKAAMTGRLLSHIRANPLLHTQRPVRSPCYSVVSFIQSMSFRPAFAMLLAVLVGLSSGTAAAWSAESTLPGDLLYPIKTRVSEPLVRAMRFANSIPDKVNYEWSLVEKRLEEAERLSAARQLEAQSAAVKKAILAQRITALRTAKKFLPEEAPSTGASEQTVTAPALTAKSSTAPAPAALKRAAPSAPASKREAIQAEKAAPKGISDREELVSDPAPASGQAGEVSLPETASAPPPVETRGTYREAARKIDALFDKHQGIVAELGLRLELQNGHTKEERSEEKTKLNSEKAEEVLGE